MKKRAYGTGSLLKRGAIWQMSYRTAEGKRITRSTGTGNKRDAESILAETTRQETLIREGVVTREEIRQRDGGSLDLDGLLEEWAKDLKLAGRTENYIATNKRLCRNLFESRGWSNPTDFNRADAKAELSMLEARDMSARTLEARRTAWRAFQLWMETERKIQTESLKGLRTPPVATNRVNRKRPLLREEWSWLIEGAEARGTKCGLTAEERILVYAIALATGYRGGELRRLKRSDLREVSGHWTLCLDQGRTKNRRDAIQFLRDADAKVLLDRVSHLAPAASLLKLPQHAQDLTRMLTGDLEEARRLALLDARSNPGTKALLESDGFLAVEDGRGRRLSFHSLRFSCGLWLLQGGASWQAVQRQMRHADLKITSEVYGAEFPEQRHEEIGGLPGIMGDPGELAYTPPTPSKTVSQTASQFSIA